MLQTLCGTFLWAQFEKQRVNDPSEFNSMIGYETFTAVSYLDQYYKLMEDPTLDPATKGVIKELTYHLKVTVEDFRSSYMKYAEDNDTFFDPETGNNVTKPYDDYQFYDYKATKISNLYSALMCAASNHKDTGKKCH